MNYSSNYLAQVSLLLRVLPLINEQECFALKGGTAINLFLRDMPRLSVDIDLTYLPIEPRDIFLEEITTALKTLATNISKLSSNYLVKEMFTKNKQLTKLLVFSDQINIIIEPNLVLRGAVFDCEEKNLCQQAQDEFLLFCKVRTLSFADIYAGKICAALSRQHPRDLFDVKLLLENEGLTEKIRKAFVVYLASHSRPIHELLNPNPNVQPIKELYEQGFVGMTKTNVSYDELVATRFDLVKLLLKSLSEKERKFLLSVKEGNPNWTLLPIPGIEKLPGLEWKRLNILKMDKIKHKEALQKLKNILVV